MKLVELQYKGIDSKVRTPTGMGWEPESWSRIYWESLMKWKHGVQNSVESFLPVETASLLSAAVAKSLQSCLTLCDPIDGSPPGSPKEYWSGVPLPSPSLLSTEP